MKYAFILALGRSGTEFLSRMLQHDTHAAVYHEPYEEDPIILNLRHAGFNRVADKMMTSRFDKMSERSAGRDIHIEINSYLRYEAPWLKKNLHADILHLVRDGRTFLPSAFVRDVYTPADIQRPSSPTTATRMQNDARYAGQSAQYPQKNTPTFRPVEHGTEGFIPYHLWRDNGTPWIFAVDRPIQRHPGSGLQKRLKLKDDGFNRRIKTVRIENRYLCSQWVPPRFIFLATGLSHHVAPLVRPDQLRSAAESGKMHGAR